MLALGSETRRTGPLLQAASNRAAVVARRKRDVQCRRMPVAPVARWSTENTTAYGAGAKPDAGPGGRRPGLAQPRAAPGLERLVGVRHVVGAGVARFACVAFGFLRAITLALVAAAHVRVLALAAAPVVGRR